MLGGGWRWGKFPPDGGYGSPVHSLWAWVMFEADCFLGGTLLQFRGDFEVLWSPSWCFSESMPGTSHLQHAWAPQAPCLLFLQPVRSARILSRFPCWGLFAHLVGTILDSGTLDNPTLAHLTLGHAHASLVPTNSGNEGQSQCSSNSPSFWLLHLSFPKDLVNASPLNAR